MASRIRHGGRAAAWTPRPVHAKRHRSPRIAGGLRRAAVAVGVTMCSLAYSALGPIPASEARASEAAERLEVRRAAAAEARRLQDATVRQAALAAADLQADQAERATAEMQLLLAAQAEAARLAAQAEAERLAAQAEAERLAAEAAAAARRAEEQRAAEAAAKRAAQARAAAARAAAPAPAGPDRSPGWEQRLGAEALARIRYPVASLNYDIRFLPGRPGLLGMADTDQKWIEIYVRTSHSVEDLAVTLAHEIGHAVDDRFNTPERRREYLRMRGLPVGLPWFGCDVCTDFATPAGDFAEVFAVAQFGPAHWQGRLGPAPSVVQVADLARFFGP